MQQRLTHLLLALWVVLISLSQAIAVNAPPGFTIDGLEAGRTWTARDSDRAWTAVASSADGTKLVAAEYNSTYAYTSTDSGATWTPRFTAYGRWLGVCSSADGTRLAGADYGAQIVSSIDSGVSWPTRGGIFRWFRSVACSADGTRMVAVAWQVPYGGYIYTATNNVGWIERGSYTNWTSVSSSADGSKLIAVASGDKIYISTDVGVTWTPRGNAGNWSATASSFDGTRLVAAMQGGQIYTSTDSGVTWTNRESNRSWRALASSTNGTRLVAAVEGGQIFTSTDSGVTWTARETNRQWQSVATSADGMKLVAVANGGRIYTSVGGVLTVNENALCTLTLTNITAGDGENQTLTFGATSSNPALIPTPVITYTSPNATGTLSFRPATNAIGTATITVKLQDSGGTADGGQDISTFPITVTVVPVPKPLITTTSLQPNGSFSLSGTGLAFGSFVLWSATNLNTPVQWLPLATNPSGSDGIFQFTNLEATNSKSRFYRIETP